MKRDDLVQAARELLWERGYQGTSPGEIQRRSGAGQGSFYHHFASKADLANAALRQVSDERGRQLAEIFAADKKPLERVRAYLERPREALKGCPMGRMAMEPTIADEHLNAPVRAYFDQVGQHLEQAFDEAGRPHPKRLADLVVNTVQGGYVQARIYADPTRLESACAELSELLELPAIDDELGARRRP